MYIVATVALIALLFSSVSSQLVCHRCFGNSFCNDANHLEFSEKVHNATCGGSLFANYKGDDPVLKDVERVLNENYIKTFQSIVPYNTTIEQNCITATAHEAYDTHTLRTCITRRVPTNMDFQLLCEFLHNILAPANYYNGSFSCRQCNENFCNTHTLNKGAGLKESDNAGSNASLLSIQSFGFVITIGLLLSKYI